MNHDVTDTHFNKRQTEIRFQHGLCAGPLPLRLMSVTATEKWLQKACWKPSRVYPSCVTSPLWYWCVNVHADVDQSSMAEANFMKQHGQRLRDHREIQGLNMSECWKFVDWLNPANGWPVSRQQQNVLHLGEQFPWLDLLTLTAVSIFTGGRNTSDQRSTEDLSREGFNPWDYDRYSWWVGVGGLRQGQL